jgi:hypothetical protein
VSQPARSRVMLGTLDEYTSREAVAVVTMKFRKISKNAVL